MKTKELIRQLVREIFQVTDEHLTEKTEKLEELFELLSYKEVNENTEFPVDEEEIKWPEPIILDLDFILNEKDGKLYLDDDSYDVSKIIDAIITGKPLYGKYSVSSSPAFAPIKYFVKTPTYGSTSSMNLLFDYSLVVQSDTLKYKNQSNRNAETDYVTSITQNIVEIYIYNYNKPMEL